MIKKFLQKTEPYFQSGTKKQFHLHEFLLLANIFLVFIMIYEVYAKYANLNFPHWLNQVELFFGILFLLELILYIIHIYIPNKVYFQPYLWINAFVTISLLFPGFLGNLAILRLLRTTSILKVYQYNKKLKEQQNQKFEMHSVKIIKITFHYCYSLIIKPIRKIKSKK